MKHGFETLAGDPVTFGHGSGFGDGGTLLLWILLIGVALAAIALWSEYIRLGKYIRRRNHPDPQNPMKTLKEKFYRKERPVR